jgi:hypothetical protein
LTSCCDGVAFGIVSGTGEEPTGLATLADPTFDVVFTAVGSAIYRADSLPRYPDNGSEGTIGALFIDIAPATIAGDLRLFNIAGVPHLAFLADDAGTVDIYIYDLSENLVAQTSDLALGYDTGGLGYAPNYRDAGIGVPSFFYVGTETRASAFHRYPLVVRRMTLADVLNGDGAASASDVVDLGAPDTQHMSFTDTFSIDVASDNSVYILWRNADRAWKYRNDTLLDTIPLTYVETIDESGTTTGRPTYLSTKAKCAVVASREQFTPVEG